MKNTKKGAYTIEAAIFIPIFIIAVLTIGFFIKISLSNQAVMQIIADEGRLLAAKAYVSKTPLTFQSKTEERILEEAEDVSYVNIKNFKYLYIKNENRGMISLSVEYYMNLKLPALFKEGVLKKDKVLFRGFIGASEDVVNMDFADMEKEISSLRVYVFPQSGEKYHNQKCSFISSYPTKVVFNKDIEKNYSPCKQCKPEKNQYGNIVYCFFQYGESYHNKKCKKIDKYIVAMEKYEAEKRGYTPCLKCGGIK